MRFRSRLIIVALAASLLVSLAVTSASAGRISISNAKLRITWNALRLVEPGGGGIQQTCRLTLEGSFHSATVRKVPGALISALARGIVDSRNCRGNTEPHRLTILQETLPWHVTYESFTGTLPNITSITFLLRRYEFRFSATTFGITNSCLILDGGSPEENLAYTITRNPDGSLTTLNTAPERHGRFLSGSPFPELCPPFVRLEGTAEVFLPESTTRIRATLI